MDASVDDGSFGRLINDEWRGAQNLKRKVITDTNGEPCVIFFALRDIELGDELRYDYTVTDHPWRKVQYNLTRQFILPS